MPHHTMQLLKHFKELTVRPKNAQELKGLILQLAIQGKLTSNWREENPNIEPASELLKRIQKERDRLIKEKKIKKDKLLPQISKDETSYKIPKSWAWCRLQDVIKIYSGKGLTSAKMDKSGKIPVYGGNGVTGYHNIGNVDKPTIVIGRVGFYCGSIHLTEENAWVTDNAFITYYSENNIYRDFLLLLLRGTNLKEDENATAQPVISGRKVYPIVISIPPLKEQTTIVEVVDQLFKEVEQLEQLTVERIILKEDFVTSALNQLTSNNAKKEWEFLQAHFTSFFDETSNIKKLRETVLQLAVQGKLTVEWRLQRSLSGAEVEDASILLKRIQKEKAQLIKEKKIKKEKPLPPIAKDEIPYELPEGWVWCRLGQTLLYSDSGKSPDCEKRPVTDEEWGVLTTTAIQQNKFVESANKVLPINYEINPKQIVEVGDILITRAGPINRTGIACKVDALQFNLILSDKTIRLKYIENSLFPDFLVLTLNSLSIRQLLLGKMIGMASSQVNISQANIKGICFPFPPLEEQKAIVQKVNALMGLCDALEREVKQSQEWSEQLMHRCLREVFEEKESKDYGTGDIELGMVAEEGEKYNSNN